jgi:hypothetical protein
MPAASCFLSLSSPRSIYPSPHYYHPVTVTVAVLCCDAEEEDEEHEEHEDDKTQH